jgi:sugar phosphate isomerase/epimerase
MKHGVTGAALAAGFLAAAAAEAEASVKPLGMPIGCQTYPVRALIAEDFPGTLKKLSDAGFERIELCSPGNYGKSGFAVLDKYKGPELRKLLAGYGLKTESSHFGSRELRESFPAAIGWATDVGLKQMMVPSLNGPTPNPTMDDVKRIADEFNKIGEKTKAAGIQLGLHNEGFELTQVNGQRTYDVLFGLLDPQLVKFQFQVSTISQGYDAADYFTRYPGRFISMHVQDWDPVAKKTVAVGTGTLDWKKIFKAAKVGGIKNYFVEMTLDQMALSVPYLKKLKV